MPCHRKRRSVAIGTVDSIARMADPFFRDDVYFFVRRAGKSPSAIVRR